MLLLPLVNLLEVEPIGGTFREGGFPLDFTVQLFLLLQVEVGPGKVFRMMVDISRIGIFLRDDWGYFMIEAYLLDEAIGDSRLGDGRLLLVVFGRGGRGLLEGVEGVAAGVDVEVDDEGRMWLHLE